MHICELVRLFPTHSAGGMQNHAAILARMLVRQGHRVTLLTAELPGVDEEEVGGVRVVYIPGTRPDTHDRKGWAALNRMWDRLHAEDPFDVVHAHQRAGIGWAHMRRRNQLPLVVTMHGTHWNAWLTAMRSLRGKPKAQVKASLYLLWRYAVEAVTYLPLAEAMIFTSMTDLRRSRRLYPLPKRRVLIANGIEVEHFNPQAEPAPLKTQLGVGESECIILGTGRIIRDKGFETVIQALADWDGPPANFVLLGDGPYTEQLQHLVAALGLRDRVKLLPTVSQELLPRYMAAADLYIFPTWCEEGAPLALLEAMAMGLPIIASNFSAVRDIVSDEETAVLVPPMDPGALRGAMTSLLSHPDRAAKLGKAARRTAVERFSVSQMGVQTGAVLEAAAGLRSWVF